MSNVIKFPVIAGIEISTDENGRFNLNALHKASGGEPKNRPSRWLENEQTQKLIEELSRNSGLGFDAVNSVKGGKAPGTFAHELLAVSYAGWISPTFQLQVNQIFIDYRTGSLQPAIPKTFAEAMRLAADQAEMNLRLESENKELKPKATALDRIATSDGSLCITNAAKDLQMRPRDLFAWLSAHQWIYKRPGGAGWIAYQDKLQTGRLEHKITVVSRTDGSEKTTEQVRVTPKGLTVLSKAMNRTAA